MVFDDIVSTVDIINGNKVNVQANGVLPTINIEKSAGVTVYMTSTASRSAEVVTSLSSEVNLVVPGATENDNPSEFALPYQVCILSQYLTISTFHRLTLSIVVCDV